MKRYKAKVERTYSIVDPTDGSLIESITEPKEELSLRQTLYARIRELRRDEREHRKENKQKEMQEKKEIVKAKLEERRRRIEALDAELGIVKKPRKEKVEGEEEQEEDKPKTKKEKARKR